MNNFVHDGHVIEVIAPYEVMSGDGVLCGSLFGIAMSWAQKGDAVNISTAGVFDLKRQLTDHWQVGEPIYWNPETISVTREHYGAVVVGVAVSSTGGDDKPWVRSKLLGFVRS